MTITIIGGGITSLVVSLFLAKRGYQVEIYESRPDIRLEKKKYFSGRATSIDISARSLVTFEQLGLKEEIMRLSVPMNKRVFHLLNENTVTINFGEEKNIYAISRNHIFITLLEEIEKTSAIQMFFDHHFVDLDTDANQISFIDKTTQKTIQKSVSGMVIGCDGANSNVRKVIEAKRKKKFTHTYVPYQYKELSIPIENAKIFEKNAMHMWPQDEMMLLAQPNTDGSAICALILNRDSQNNFKNLLTEVDIEKFFQKYFPDLLKCIPDLSKQFMENPVGNFMTIDNGPWFYKDKILLLGDSAHTMVPFFGQGINCCLEDCAVLNNYLTKYNDDWEKVLPLFEEERLKDTTAITQLSLENYPELQKNSIEKSILERQIDEAIQNKFPEYTSFHSVVCFNTLPYRYALACKALQKQLLARISKSIQKFSDLNLDKFSDELKDYFQNFQVLKY